MIDLLKSHSTQKNHHNKPTTKKQAFKQANVNSILHTERQGDTLVASLYIEPMESLSNTPDNTKGRMRFLTVRQGRRMRSRSILRDSQAFITALQWDCTSVIQKADREGLRAVLRLPIVDGVEWPDYSCDWITQEYFLMA